MQNATSIYNRAQMYSFTDIFARFDTSASSCGPATFRSREQPVVHVILYPGYKCYVFTYHTAHEYLFCDLNAALSHAAHFAPVVASSAPMPGAIMRALIGPLWGANSARIMCTQALDLLPDIKNIILHLLLR